MGLLQKGVLCNGLEASLFVGDILRGMKKEDSQQAVFDA